MLILHNARNNEENPGVSIAAVFGVGLIGFHLVQNLYKHQYKTAYILPFSWQGSSQRKKEKMDILNYIRQILTKLTGAATQKADGLCRIDFVWSAGKGGFGMSQSDTLPEMDSFSKVVEIAIAVFRENPSCLVRFHMLSSAGGLYEGQRNVNTTSLPDPRRPYGFLKLAQEKILGDCAGLIQFIYRPTSVYGFAGLNHRLGLIPTLLRNGSKNKVSTIFGTPETLRDYLWADDVGAFIAGIIAAKTSCSGRFVLASGKPSALFEIFNHIEKILNKKLFCHYIQNGGNAEHNTFSLRARPVGWNPLDLETGIRKTFHAML
jgi:nucleoside-diphosphate-sugar epimerase